MADWLKAALDYIPTWLDLQLRIARQPGCAIAIAHRGRIVLEHACGHADCDRGEALTSRHRFRAASHTKSFTAAGLLKLRETGKLRLDHPIERYVPGLDRRVGRLEIRQVLCHGGGLSRDGTDCGYFADRRPYPTPEELLTDLATSPLTKPSTRFKYSNQGYGLLGLVLEAASGEPYASFIKREVIDAAGLQETTPDMPAADGVPFARGHTDDLLLGRRIVVPGDYAMAALAAAGGVVSTAGDLALFFSQLSPRTSTSILSAASRREMTRRRLANRQPGPDIHYGLGTMSGTAGGWNWFGHNGGLQGYVSRTRVVPAYDLAVSVLANSADAPVEPWTDGILHILRTFKQRGRASGRATGWTGRWWGLWGAIDLVPMGRVVMVANPQGAQPFAEASEVQVTGRDSGRVVVSSGTRYYGEGARRTRDEAGGVATVWLGGDKFVPREERAAELMWQYDHGPAAIDVRKRAPR
jgi:CubicO group peptidase (beta-lactamase class C family)